jgi:hypothetical protein
MATGTKSPARQSYGQDMTFVAGIVAVPPQLSWLMVSVFIGAECRGGNGSVGQIS